MDTRRTAAQASEVERYDGDDIPWMLTGGCDSLVNSSGTRHLYGLVTYPSPSRYRRALPCTSFASGRSDMANGTSVALDAPMAGGRVGKLGGLVFGVVLVGGIAFVGANLVGDLGDVRTTPSWA